MGPSAFSLLSRRRSLLLELPAPSGPPVRRRVWVTHAAERPGLLLRTDDELPAADAHAGDPLAVVVPMSGCIWRFPTHVVERRDDGDTRLLLAWPHSVERIAGRRHPRVPIMLGARVREERVGARLVGTYTLDVSGGGLQFASPIVLPPGSVARVTLAVPGGPVELLAEVMWLRAVHAHPEDPMYRIGAAFRSVVGNGRQRLLTWLRRQAMADDET